MWTDAERFLSVTARAPADVLVVEGWIGDPALAAAAREFNGGYRFVVTTGGLTPKVWGSRQWNYAEVGKRVLHLHGIAEEQIVSAPAADAETQRTLESAVAVCQAVHAKAIEVRSVNIFTLGAHARRTRLVFEKVFGPAVKVGVIGWKPPGWRAGPWWRSSDRAIDVVTEGAGYLFELLLNSGRRGEDTCNQKKGTKD